ncbi:MAG TPA: hypothetical protein DCX54_13650 [Flavobacteriales bacterium]|nr:hypothetical protein [Flavobacteriales bacterium]
MIKYLIILLNIISLIGIKVLFPGGISVTSDMPETVKAGDEFVITVRIEKGDLSGFAKFTQDLPKTFTASLVNGSDATFSFKDNKVKFIWVALPLDQDFSFSYKVKVDVGVAGNFKVGGVFAYIFDNEKQTAELETKTLRVGTDAPVAKTEEPIKGYIEEEILDIKCKRTTSVIPGLVNTFKVELRIDKPEINGFAKVEESIPDGFYASELDSDEGIFSFENQLVKILWMALPDKKQFIVSYKLTAKNDVHGNQKISGVFSYLMGNESVKYFVAASTIFIERDNGEDVPTIIIADDGGDFKEKEVAAAPLVVPEPEPEPEIAPEPEVEVETVAVIPEPQTDITYKVQVAAGHKPVDNTYFAKKYNLQEDISIENHQGWIKYTFGDFGVYKDCRDKRNVVWDKNKISDAFVTAYNAGKRITVQEALMISNQKWYN